MLQFRIGRGGFPLPLPDDSNVTHLSTAARFTEPMPSSFYRVPRGVQDLIVNCTARHSFQVLRCETL